jgi:hypothetical protein
MFIIGVMIYSGLDLLSGRNTPLNCLKASHNSITGKGKGQLCSVHVISLHQAATRTKMKTIVIFPLTDDGGESIYNSEQWLSQEENGW